MKNLKNYVPEVFLIMVLLTISFAAGRTYGNKECMEKFHADFVELSNNNDSIQAELDKIIINDSKIKNNQEAIEGYIGSGVTEPK